jgi:hypothetical protein
VQQAQEMGSHEGEFIILRCNMNKYQTIYCSKDVILLKHRAVGDRTKISNTIIAMK